MSVQNTTGFSASPVFIFTSNPLALVLLYRYGLGFKFLIGFTGNLASIITFMRPILRTTSTGRLFLVLAVSDIMFLLAFCWYLKGFIRFCSAWILDL